MEAADELGGGGKEQASLMKKEGSHFKCLANNLNMKHAVSFMNL